MVAAGEVEEFRALNAVLPAFRAMRRDIIMAEPRFELAELRQREKLQTARALL
jgi:hypothetical protein